MKSFVRSSIKKQIVFIFSCVVVPMLIISIYATSYSIKTLQEQFMVTNQLMLRVWQNQINTSFEEASKYLFVSSNQLSFKILSLDRRDDDHILYRSKIWTELQSKANDYAYIDAMFLTDHSGTHVTNTRAQPALSTYLKMNIAELSGGWHIIPFEEDLFFLQIYEFVNIKVGFASTASSLANKVTNLSDDIIGTLSVNHVDFQPEQKGYLVIAQDSLEYPYRLLLRVPEGLVLQSLPFVRNIAVLFSILAIVGIPVLVFLINKMIIYPLSGISRAIKKLEHGDTEYRIPDIDAAEEFLQINQAFNSMSEQNKKLKIQVYEDRIIKQRARLRILELQVNPHFLLNCLNIIYYLALGKETQTIVQLAQNMTGFFRLRLRREHELVTIDDEIKMVEEYIHIAQIRFPGCVHARIAIAPQLGDKLIPPLLVQIFVENVVKHTVALDTNIQIDIRGDLVGDQVEFTIQDNGDGIPRDMLVKIQRGERIFAEDGEHFGLKNAKERIEELPGGALTISSEEGAGTTVQFTFHLLEDERSVRHEFTDPHPAC